MFNFCQQISDADIAFANLQAVGSSLTSSNAQALNSAACTGQYVCIADANPAHKQGLGSVQTIAQMPDFAGGDKGQGVVFTNVLGNTGTRGTSATDVATTTIYMFCDPLLHDFYDNNADAIYHYRILNQPTYFGGTSGYSQDQYNFANAGTNPNLVFLASSRYACSRRLNVLSSQYLPNVVGWNDLVGYTLTVSDSTQPSDEYLTTDDTDLVVLQACENANNVHPTQVEASSLQTPTLLVPDQYPFGCFILTADVIPQPQASTNSFVVFENGVATINGFFGGRRLSYLVATMPVDPYFGQSINGRNPPSNGVPFDTTMFTRVDGLYRGSAIISLNQARASDFEAPTKIKPDPGSSLGPWNILTNCHAPPPITNGYWDCANGTAFSGTSDNANYTHGGHNSGPLYTVVTHLAGYGSTSYIHDWDISETAYETTPYVPATLISTYVDPRPLTGTDIPETASTCTMKCNKGYQLSPLASRVFTTTCQFGGEAVQAEWSPLPGVNGPACVPVTTQHSVGSPCSSTSVPQICPPGYVSMQDALISMVANNIGHETDFSNAGYDPYCYKVYPPFTAASYDAAQTICLNDGGNLGVVTSLQQHVFISKLASGSKASNSYPDLGTFGYPAGALVNPNSDSGYINVFPSGVNGGPILLRGQYSPLTSQWQWYVPPAGSTTPVPPLLTSAILGNSYTAWASGQPTDTFLGTELCMGIDPCHKEDPNALYCVEYAGGSNYTWSVIPNCDNVYMNAFACMAPRTMPAGDSTELRNVYIGRIISPQTFIPVFAHVSDFRQFAITWDSTLTNSQTPLSSSGKYRVTISSLATPNSYLGSNQPIFNNGDIVYISNILSPEQIGSTPNAFGNPSFVTIDLSDNTLYENRVYLSLPNILQDGVTYQISIKDATDPNMLVGYTCFTAGYSTQYCANNINAGNGVGLLSSISVTTSFDPSTADVSFTVRLPYLTQGYIWDIDFQPWNFDLTSTTQCAVLTSLPAASSAYNSNSQLNTFADLFSVAPSAYWLMNAFVSTNNPSGVMGTTYYDFPLGFFYSISPWTVTAPASSSSTASNCGFLTFTYTATAADMLANCNMLINPHSQRAVGDVVYSGTVYATAIAVADAHAQPEPGINNICGATRSCYSAITYAVNYQITIQGLNSVITSQTTASQIAADSGLSFQLLSVVPSGSFTDLTGGATVAQVVIVVRVVTSQLDDSIPASADSPSGADVYVNGLALVGTSVTQGAFVINAQPPLYQRDYQYTIPNGPLVTTYNFHFRRRGCAVSNPGCATLSGPQTGISIPLGNPDYVFNAPVDLAQVAPSLIVQAPLTLTISGATGVNPVSGAAVFQGGDVITFDVKASALLGVQLVLQNAWVCTSSGAAPTTANGGCQTPNGGAATGPVTQILYIPIASVVAVTATCSSATCTLVLPHVYYEIGGQTDVADKFATHQIVEFQTGTKDYEKKLQLSAAPLQSTNQLYYIEIQALVTASSSSKREGDVVNMIVRGETTRATASQQQEQLSSYTVAGGTPIISSTNGAVSTTSTSPSGSTTTSMWAWLGPVIGVGVLLVVAGIALAARLRRRRATEKVGKKLVEEEDSSNTLTKKKAAAGEEDDEGTETQKLFTKESYMTAATLERESEVDVASETSDDALLAASSSSAAAASESEASSTPVSSSSTVGTTAATSATVSSSALSSAPPTSSSAAPLSTQTMTDEEDEEDSQESASPRTAGSSRSRGSRSDRRSGRPRDSRTLSERSSRDRRGTRDSRYD